MNGHELIILFWSGERQFKNLGFFFIFGTSRFTITLVAYSNLHTTRSVNGPNVCSAILFCARKPSIFYLLQLQSKILILTICAAGIGGTFQYGYNISIINAPTAVSTASLRAPLLPSVWLWAAARRENMQSANTEGEMGRVRCSLCMLGISSFSRAALERDLVSQEFTQKLWFNCFSKSNTKVCQPASFETDFCP